MYALVRSYTPPDKTAVRAQEQLLGKMIGPCCALWRTGNAFVVLECSGGGGWGWLMSGDQSWVFIGRTDIEAETPILWLPHAKC